MKNVLMAKTKSRRHDLFLDKKEWQWSASSSRVKNSRLSQLMNLYLVEEHHGTAIGFALGETVFLKFLSQADPQLRKVVTDLGKQMPVMYSLYVLFPETLIHKLEVIYHLCFTF